MTTRRRLALPPAFALLAACASAPVDELPVPTVPPRSFDAVVIVYDPQGPTLGSGVVLAPTRLLTVEHLFPEGAERGSVHAREVDGEPVTLTLLDSSSLAEEAGDWALATCEPALSRRAANVHAAAADEGWTPAPGTAVFVAGYAAAFFPERRVDVTAATPYVVARAVAPQEDDARTDAMWPVADVPIDLGGMSGGGAFVWSEERERVELVGLLSSQTPVVAATEHTLRFLGLRLWSWDEDEHDGWVHWIQPLPRAVLSPPVAPTAALPAAHPRPSSSPSSPGCASARGT